MRTQAFGEEPPGTLLSAVEVALTSLDIISSDLTGLVFDVRREAAGTPAATEGDVVASALAQTERELTRPE